METIIYYEDVDGVCIYDNISKYGVSIDKDETEKEYEMYEIICVVFDDNKDNEVYDRWNENGHHYFMQEVINLFDEYDNNGDYCSGSTYGFFCPINNFTENKIDIAEKILKTFIEYT